MNDLNQARLASGLAVVAGAWLMLSPIWISMTGAALVSTLITGGAIALFGVVQLFVKQTWPSWLLALGAIWLLVSAFLFTMSTGAVWSLVLTAVATFVLANWDNIEVGHVREHPARTI